MAEHLPATTRGELVANARGGEALLTLRRALAGMDDQRAALVEAGDWESLAVGLDAIRRFKKDLDVLVQQIAADVAGLLPEKRAEIPGWGVVEMRTGKRRKAWQSEELLAELVKRALVDPSTGEVESDPAEVRERLLEVLTAAVPFTGSLSWRVTALKNMGLDPDEWCEVDGYTTSIQTIHEDGT